jgi:hypothetical protein
MAVAFPLTGLRDKRISHNKPSHNAGQYRIQALRGRRAFTSKQYLKFSSYLKEDTPRHHY